MNLKAVELADIAEYLKRHGYFATTRSGVVIVQDPVHQLASNGMARIVSHKDVRISDWDAATKFVNERE